MVKENKNKTNFATLYLTVVFLIISSILGMFSGVGAFWIMGYLGNNVFFAHAYSYMIGSCFALVFYSLFLSSLQGRVKTNEKN